MKKLKDLTKDEYLALQAIGGLEALYPEATGDITKDIKAEAREVEVTIYAYASKDTLFDIADKLNMDEDAARMLSYAQEYVIKATVDRSTGSVTIISVEL